MNIKMCSGIGRNHTNNPDSSNPKPYLTVLFSYIVAMAAMPPTVLKQFAQWFIPSILLSRSKVEQFKHGVFSCLVADIDHNPPAVKKLAGIITLFFPGCGFLIYTSRSATESCQKSHILVPTKKLTGYRWQLAQSHFNDLLEQAGVTPDRKTEDHNQIYFLPNRGVFYDYSHQKGDDFDPVKDPNFRAGMINKHQAIEADKQERTIKKSSQAIKPNSNGHSLIYAFNDNNPVEDLLIQKNYAQKGSCFRHPNSKTGNYSASVKNGKVFTLSSSDPLYSPFAHDAFSVFVILFNDGDRKAAMRNAGDNWLSVNGISWNKHQQQAYMESRK